jgi:hypothetical protein
VMLSHGNQSRQAHPRPHSHQIVEQTPNPCSLHYSRLSVFDSPGSYTLPPVRDPQLSLYISPVLLVKDWL